MLDTQQPGASGNPNDRLMVDAAGANDYKERYCLPVSLMYCGNK